MNWVNQNQQGRAGKSVSGETASGKSASQGSRQQLLGQLQKKIERIEKTGRVDDGQTVSSGCGAIDQVLPAGGYQRGAIVEWMVGQRRAGSQSRFDHWRKSQADSFAADSLSGGCGADYLALLAAKNACSDGGALVIADLFRQFNPSAAAAIGIDLGNVIVLRPERGEVLSGSSSSNKSSSRESSSKERFDSFFWSIDQALRCSAVAAVWATLGQVHERWFRRFQLSAESSGALGLFVRPASRLCQPSWSEVQWHATGIMPQVKTMAQVKTAKPTLVTAASLLQQTLSRTASNGAYGSNREYGSAMQQVQLELTRCRGTRTGQKIKLDIDTITGSVCGSRERSDYEQLGKQLDETMPLSVASQLAHSAAGGAKARA